MITTFKITNTKLYVPTVTLSFKDNAKLLKLLEEFKRPIYWNWYQKNESRALNNNNITRFPFDASFQGGRRVNTTATVANHSINNTNNRVLRNSCKKYFLPRVNITNYNVLIDETFMINQLMTW